MTTSLIRLLLATGGGPKREELPEREEACHAAIADAPRSLGRSCAPLGFARVEVCGTVFAVGGHDALDPAGFDLRSNKNAAATETLSVGAHLLLGEAQIG